MWTVCQYGDNLARLTLFAPDLSSIQTHVVIQKRLSTRNQAEKVLRLQVRLRKKIRVYVKQVINKLHRWPKWMRFISGLLDTPSSVVSFEKRHGRSSFSLFFPCQRWWQEHRYSEWICFKTIWHSVNVLANRSTWHQDVWKHNSCLTAADQDCAWP